jgi:hypothetical protein
MTKWYVTIDKQSSYIDEPDECVWTVSRDPNTTGWCTDSGYSGYGLTKADAEELANAANEIERLREMKDDWRAAMTENHDLWNENERLRARVDLLSGYLRGALNVIEGFVACDTEDARAALEGEKKNDAAT